MPTGRFAPSPTGDLHIGNLRTALLAWLFARSSDSPFIVRMEDLDPVTSSRAHEQQQLRDLAAIGIDWDGEVVRQSERFALYNDAIATLHANSATYPCFCTRREIAEAASAPHEHLPDGAYPGTCRDLSSREQDARRSEGRKEAVRFRAHAEVITFHDRVHGPTTAIVDDFVLRRADGMPAYNLAVVVDDAAQGVEEVVRGDDLLLGTLRQIVLGRTLGLPKLSYAHVPLARNESGQRLAKRDGAVTLSDLAAIGHGPLSVLAMLSESLSLSTPGEVVVARDLVARLQPNLLSTSPWVPEIRRS
jgi:glutamyl-tRNA synthetase